MGRWSASWDPETMLRLENRLDAQVDALFHDRQPDGCPTDLLERQAYLRALALVELLEGKGVRLGRPEIVRRRRSHQPDPNGRPTHRLGTPRRATGQGPGYVGQRQEDGALHGGGAQRGDHRRTRTVEPRPHRPG